MLVWDVLVTDAHVLIPTAVWWLAALDAFGSVLLVSFYSVQIMAYNLHTLTCITL